MPSRFLVFALVLATCFDSYAAPTKTPPPKRPAVKAKPAAPTAPRPPAKPARDTGPLAALTPLPSGPGVIVGDPTADGTAVAPETLALGAGCARWLQLELSNHLDLGQMPQWHAYAAVAADARLTGGKLAADDVERIGRITGVTHVVTGTVSGDATSIVLSFELRALPAGTAVGTPVQLTGTPEKIVEALPGTARELLGQLKASPDGVPDTCGATPAQLALYGTVPLVPNQPLPEKLRRELRLDVGTVPLAGLLSWRSAGGVLNSMPLRRISKIDNLALQSLVAITDPSLLHTFPPAWRTALSEERPNFLLHTTQARRSESEGQYATATQAYEFAARSAPANFDAWLGLARCIARRASSIRKGRTIGDMNTTELETSTSYYPAWQAAAARAVAVNPKSSEAQLELASAATFNSDRGIATAAFWRALALDPENQRVYWWGLQMFQPKWGYQPDQLSRVMTTACATPARMRLNYSDVLDATAMAQYQVPGSFALLDKLFTAVVLDPKGIFTTLPTPQSTLRAAWQAVHKTPNDKRAWQRMAELMDKAAEEIRQSRGVGELAWQERDPRMLALCWREMAARRWTELDAKNAMAWLALAKAGMDTGSGSRSLGMGMVGWYVDRALELAPKNVEVHKFALKNVLPGTEATPEETWHALARASADPVILAAVTPMAAAALPKPGTRTAAQQRIAGRIEAALAVAKKSESAAVQEELGDYLQFVGRLDEALEAHAAWARLAPSAARPRMAQGVIWYSRNEPGKALDFYREAIAADPKFGPVFQYMGDLLAKQPAKGGVSPLAEAREMMQRASEIMPFNQYSWASLARIEERMGRYAEARDAHRQVLKLAYPGSDTANNASERLQTLGEIRVHQRSGTD